MRTTLFAMSLLLLAACGGGGGGGTTPNDGPVQARFENKAQTAEAVDGRFLPVVGKVTRTRTAADWELRLVTPAYADTTASVGTPVPNAQVCMPPSADAQNGGPLPDAMCKRSNQNALVSFTFSPGIRASTYPYVPTVEQADGTFALSKDTVRLVVLPRAPVSTRRVVGQSESRGTVFGTPATASVPPDLFLDAAGQPAAYRVQATNYLRAKGDTLGTVAGRTLVFQRDAPVGDTATVTFHSATKEIGRARAEVESKLVEPNNTGYIVRLTYLSFTLP